MPTPTHKNEGLPNHTIPMALRDCDPAGCGRWIGMAFSTVSLPPFAFKYGGDTLWALLIFLGFGFVLNRPRTRWVALMAFAFCCAVEFTQLYHAPWIESLRSTRFGILVLGSGLNWPDLIAYGAGIIPGYLAEMILCRGSKP